MEEIGNYTGIGRGLDPRNPTNLAIFGIAALGGAVGAIVPFLSGAGLMESVGSGFVTGLAAFMGWALSREVDPDYPWSAFVAPFLALAGVLVYGQPALLFSLWALIVLRVLNRTTGMPAKNLDQLSVLVFSLWLAFQGFWLAGLAAALVFVLDAVLTWPNRQQLVYATLAALGTLVLMAFRPSLASPLPGLGTLLLGGAAGLVFLLVILNSRELRSTCDYAGSPLSPRRVQWAQWIALAVAVLTVAFYGQDGLLLSMPLWAALLGTGLYRLGVLAFAQDQPAAK
jgi:preprotein translocase subunit SecE